MGIWRPERLGDLPTHYYAQWIFCWRCNLACPYCDSRITLAAAAKAGKFWWTDEQASTAWQKTYDRYGPMVILAVGAEPLLRVEMLAELHRIGHYPIVNTNLFREPAEWVDILPAYEDLRIYPSFHPEAWGRKTEGFLERRAHLNGLGYDVQSASIVAYPPYLPDLLPPWVEELEAAGVYVTVHPFSGEFEGQTYPAAYTEEQKDLIRSFLRDEQDHFRLQQKPWRGYCAVGILTANIQPDGDVKRCSAGATHPVFKDQNFFDDGLHLAETLARCDAKYCPCHEMWKYHIPDGDTCEWPADVHVDDSVQPAPPVEGAD